MTTEKISMSVSVVGTDDGKETYEVRRAWNDGAKKALVLELYPTISTKNPMILDMSTLHLLNHSAELGWGDVRIVNLYPYVFGSKPVVNNLHESVENMEKIDNPFLWAVIYCIFLQKMIILHHLMFWLRHITLPRGYMNLMILYGKIVQQTLCGKDDIINCHPMMH